MAWEQIQIGIGDATVMGNINTSGEKTRIEMPFDKAYEDATELNIDGKTLTIQSSVNVGGRDETLLTEVEKHESKKRRNKDKVGE
tara:strand:+ start:614 stop:868 length:255 start_codon:yes stop_codon:yes gene_type:complete